MLPLSFYKMITVGEQRRKLHTHTHHWIVGSDILLFRFFYPNWAEILIYFCWKSLCLCWYLLRAVMYPYQLMSYFVHLRNLQRKITFCFAGNWLLIRFSLLYRQTVLWRWHGRSYFGRSWRLCGWFSNSIRIAGTIITAISRLGSNRTIL